MSDEHKASALSPNTVLSSGKQTYKIEKILGAGSFGITYLATTQIMFGNISHKIKVAIKEHFMDSCYRGDDGMQVRCTPTSKTEVEQSRADFLTEAKRLQKICQKSKYIVNVNETFVANGTAYYVMEYLDGGKPGKMSEVEAIETIRLLCEAVSVLHDERLLHMDIKPDNIMIHKGDDGSKYPVLIDFGISKHFGINGRPTSRLKAKGASTGYAPMEQYEEIVEFSPGIDIYALGAVLLYLLTGKNPPSAFKISNSQSEILELISKEVAENTRQFILKAMVPNNADRCQNVRSLMALLASDTSVDTTPISNTTTPKEPVEGRLLDKRKLKPYFQLQSKALKISILSFSILLILCLCVPALFEKIKRSDNSTNTDIMDELSGEDWYKLGELYEEKYNDTDSIVFLYKIEECFNKAIEKGNVDALSSLADLYFTEDSVFGKKTEVFSLTLKAFELGDTSVSDCLALYYIIGDNQWPDSLKGVSEWLDFTNFQGIGYSSASDYYGLGVKRDFGKALYFAKIAESKGYNFGYDRRLLGMMYEFGLGVKQNLDSASYYYKDCPDLQKRIADKEWVDLALPSGTKWATSNVGASRPYEAGQKFSWGESSEKELYNSKTGLTTGETLSSIKGNRELNAAISVCGSSWEIPTKDQWQELIDNCTWSWTELDGQTGYKVQGKNGKSIFLPAAGYKNGTINERQGKDGGYWSSDGITDSKNNMCYYLLIDDNFKGVNHSYRFYGRSIRPVLKN